MPPWSGLPDGLVVDDLPVLLGHQIVDGKQRLAAEHADAPVILGRDEFLGDQQVGILQPLLGQRLQLGEIGGLLDAARKRAVGDLQHQREAERLRRDLEVGGPAIITVGGIGTLL